MIIPMSIQRLNRLGRVVPEFEMNVSKAFAHPRLLVLCQKQFLNRPKLLDQVLQVIFCGGLAQVGNPDCCGIISPGHVRVVRSLAGTFSQIGRHIFASSHFRRVCSVDNSPLFLQSAATC